MDTKTQTAADRVYEDVEPYHQWDKYDGRFTVMLPGYTRDQIKVQVTSKPALRLMGERPTYQNRWLRFKLEFPIPSDYDIDNVTATFEGGKLSVKFAKLNKPKETTTDPPEEAPRPKEPTTTTNPPVEAPRPEEPSQKVDEQKGVQEGTPKAKEEKAEIKTDDVSDQNTPPQKKDSITEKSKTETAASMDKVADRVTTDDVSDQNTPPQKEKDSITEKSKTKTAASMDKVADRVTTDGSTEKTDAATSVAPKTKDAKIVARTKTRLIDFSLSKALSNQDENEALGDLTAGLNKWKKLIAWIMLIFLVVGVGLYCRNAFRSSQEEWNNFEELLLSPY